MVVILNTGGTFNKIYDPVSGTLVVPKDNRAVEDIIKHLQIDIKVKGLIYKDSLDMDDKDREILVDQVKKIDSNLIVIVHGTDTMDKSALALSKANLNKQIVLTGAMVPYSICKTEASLNLMLAISEVKHISKAGVFIAMQGIFDRFDKVYKDRKRGVFCLK